MCHILGYKENFSTLYEVEILQYSDHSVLKLDINKNQNHKDTFI